jgi:2'-5' RNA ligase
MAFLGIRAPHEAARLIHEIDVPGEKEDSAHLHITLLYLGKDVPVEELARAMIATYSVTKETSPFWVSLNCVNYFPVPDGVPFPIIAPVVSPKLHELRKNLTKTFGRAKIDYDKKFKLYKPHVTLSFNEESIKKTKIEPIEWSVQELVLWGGSNGDNRVFVTFPLELPKNEEISELCCKEEDKE